MGHVDAINGYCPYHLYERDSNYCHFIQYASGNNRYSMFCPMSHIWTTKFENGVYWCVSQDGSLVQDGTCTGLTLPSTL